MPDRVTWTGLNVRDVARVCRDLLRWNAANPTNPAIWYTGRSRIEPEKNTVTLRTVGGLVKVRAGDTIVRHADGSFTVERGA